MEKKILAIVPMYNEEHSAKKVIDDLLSASVKVDILVVNDGSTDKTSEVVKSTNVAHIVDLPVNLGIGGGVQTGFLYAKRNNYDIALQFDGDGQHRADEIEILIEPILKGEADAVIGSRFCHSEEGFKSSRSRRIGIKIFEIVNGILTGEKITDNTSGFRAYNKEALSFLAENYPHDYPEPEAVILLSRNRFRIAERPAKMRERQGGTSSIFGIKAAYYMVKVLFGIFMAFMRAPIRKG